MCSPMNTTTWIITTLALGGARVGGAQLGLCAVEDIFPVCRWYNPRKYTRFGPEYQPIYIQLLLLDKSHTLYRLINLECIAPIESRVINPLTIYTTIVINLIYPSLMFHHFIDAIRGRIIIMQSRAINPLTNYTTILINLIQIVTA
jgi:hypothetical protein